MANPEHLEILKQGVEQWNKWRKEIPDIDPDLSEADLDGARLGRADLDGARHNAADLHAVNLSGARLFGASLFKANLNGANLIGADLTGADLSGASFTGASLSRTGLLGANLGRVSARRQAVTLHERGADLSEADLSEADLSYADLGGADLNRTDFTAARAGGTNFAEVDLSTAKGLETIKHNGPSTIGIDTIYKSHGKIPEAFLRGCGVPDEFIAYIGSMVGRPIEFYSCFISYSTKDQEFAERLYNDLQGQ